MDRFDLAFGVGEHLVEFAQQFHDPPALMWEDFPEWLITDESGKIIPIARRPFALSGALRAMEMFLAKQPDGHIHFNLRDVTPNRSTTFGELSHIRQTPALRAVTWYYEDTQQLDDKQVNAILKTLGLS